MNSCLDKPALSDTGVLGYATVRTFHAREPSNSLREDGRSMGTMAKVRRRVNVESWNTCSFYACEQQYHLLSDCPIVCGNSLTQSYAARRSHASTSVRPSCQLEPNYYGSRRCRVREVTPFRLRY